MKRTLVALGAAAALTAPAALLAQDKPGVVAASTVETVVTVREVDQQARTVTVEGEGGRLVTFKVPDEAQNLDQVHAGAKFKVRYLESVAIAVVGAGGEPSAGQADAVEMAPKGDTPGGVITRVTQVTGSVEQIDYANRTVVVRGPEGNVRQFAVSDAVERFDNVKVGDLIVLRVTEALAMRMIKQ